LVARKTQVSLRTEPRRVSELDQPQRHSQNIHDILGMIVHASIAKVEPLEVGHGRRLNHLAELEGAAEE
jgi:predicted amino acid racemase